MPPVEPDQIIVGDCLGVLAQIPDDTVDMRFADPLRRRARRAVH